MSDTVELNGTVGNVFGHRFTLATHSGECLIDVGPHGNRAEAITPGTSVSVRGEQKHGEVKASSLRIDDDEWLTIERPEKNHAPKSSINATADTAAPASVGDDAHLGLTADDIARTLDDNGFTAPGEPVRKPKHIEVEASKDGTRHTVHIHKVGIVKKAEPVT